MSFKDLFSDQAPDYARFRPTYPPELFAWLARIGTGQEMAVDVGSGSGQAAAALAVHFDRVIAVEPSEAQLANAKSTSPRIEFRRGSAEATGVAAASADLLVAAQAFHWFAHERFFAEVARVVRPGGALAVWCYGLTEISPEIDAVVYDLYEGYLGPFWEPERKLVEVGYRTVLFPFREIAAPTFQMQVSWTLERLAGYLSTWSPLKRYLNAHGENPLALVLPRLQHAWGGATERVVSWPLAVRAFQI
jgi:SAM-dependent methyltransferase